MEVFEEMISARWGQKMMFQYNKYPLQCVR